MAMYTSGNAFGMLRDRLGERQALLDVAAHRRDHLGERLRLGLVGEDAERPDQREAGADHRRQLAGEDDDVAETDLAAATANGDVGAELRLALAGDRDRHVAQLAELGDDELLALTLDAALVDSAGLVADLVGVRRAHRPSRSGELMPKQAAQVVGVRRVLDSGLEADAIRPHQLGEVLVHRHHPEPGPGLHLAGELVALALADQVAHRGRGDQDLDRGGTPAPSAVGSSCCVTTACSVVASMTLIWPC